MASSSLLDALYSVMQSTEVNLGGGEGIQGIYGSITGAGMQKILESMHYSCGLTKRSVLVDVGAGLGRPLLHALVVFGVAGTHGVEMDPVKCQKAAAFTQRCLAHLTARGALQRQQLPEPALPRFTCAPVEKLASLDPASHAYSFWEGVPLEGKQAFGKLFKRSTTLKAVAVVQRSFRNADPCLVMAQLGFGPLQLVKQMPVKMSGSGRSFTAYIFTKPAAAAQRCLDAAAAAAPPGTPPAEELVESEGAPPPPAAAGDDGHQLAASACKPAGKRAVPPAAAAAAAAACPAALGESPTKKQCPDHQSGSQLTAAAAAGAAQQQQQEVTVSTQHYGLRPRRLDLSSSSSSTASAGSRSSNSSTQTADKAAAAAAAAAAAKKSCSAGSSSCVRAQAGGASISSRDASKQQQQQQVKGRGQSRSRSTRKQPAAAAAAAAGVEEGSKAGSRAAAGEAVAEAAAARAAGGQGATTGSTAAAAGGGVAAKDGRGVVGAAGRRQVAISSVFRQAKPHSSKAWSAVVGEEGSKQQLKTAQQLGKQLQQQRGAEAAGELGELA